MIVICIYIALGTYSYFFWLITQYRAVKTDGNLNVQLLFHWHYWEAFNIQKLPNGE